MGPRSAVAEGLSVRSRSDWLLDFRHRPLNLWLPVWQQGILAWDCPSDYFVTTTTQASFFVIAVTRSSRSATRFAS